MTITPSLIQALTTRLVEEKGIKAPDVTFSISDRGYMFWASTCEPRYETVISSGRKATSEEAVAAFIEALEALPDAETLRHTEYLEALSHVSDLATDLGYDPSFIRNEMLRLSEGALTHVPADA